ncbi:hypothetical protein BDV93DRAFT_182811 [Ceratobasidium sp. AG-I]|nr:hypothetical protein BDV93DRAFT_182811 [Ceratobasidium sp. AG-I]
MLLANSHPSSISILRIPELACIIFELIGKQNAARLGCTCRELFCSFMPLAWEHVSDATQAFNLIRGAHVIFDSNTNEVIVTLPSVVHGGDLVRLGVYAPFIKRLDFFRYRHDRCRYYQYKYTILNWESTLEYAVKRPLLANLTSIRFANLWLKPRHQCVWLNMFISPALREFDAALPDNCGKPGITTGVACVLFKRLISQCPDLQRLSLLPFTVLDPDEDELPLLGSPWQKVDVRAVYVNRLTEMSITPTMFSIFKELNCPPFPVLEHLRIYASAIEEMNPASLAQNLFPSVQELTVLRLLCKGVLHGIWRALGPALNQLIHAKLQFESCYWYECTTILEEEVTFLTIALLNKLPLERLQILGPHFDDFIPHHFQTNQGLRVLGLPHHRLEISDLHEFADAMPFLEHLSVDLRLDDNAKLSESNNASRPTALRRLESTFDERRNDTDDYNFTYSKFEEERYTSTLEFARYL